MANNATTRNVRGGTEASFTVGGKYKMTGTINGQGQVEGADLDRSMCQSMLKSKIEDW